jgi:hypothetical protein
MDPLSSVTGILKEFKELILSSKIFIIAFFIGLGGLLLLYLPDNMLGIVFVSAKKGL